MYQPWPGTAISDPTSVNTYSSLHAMGNKHWQIEYILECIGESSFGFSLSFSPSLPPLTGFSLSARRCHTNLTHAHLTPTTAAIHWLTFSQSPTQLLTRALSCQLLSRRHGCQRLLILSSSSQWVCSSLGVWSSQINPRLTCEPPTPL